MSALRIAYLISYFPPIIGGAELQASYLASEFARLGHHVTVITRHVVGRPRPDRNESYRVVEVETAAGGHRAAVEYLWRGWNALRTHGPFDIIQTSQLGSTALVGLLWQVRTGTPSVAKIEGNELQRSSYPAWQPRTLLARHSRGVIAVTPHLHEQLQNLVESTTRLVCIENAVPDMACNGDGGGEAPLTFIFVGRMEPVKGPDVVVEAWMSTPFLRERHRLVMVGTGSAVATLTRETSGERSIHWVGQTNDVRSLLCKADIYVNSSRDEGLSLALLEAMSAGLPVIAADLPGTRHALTAQNGYAGWLVPPGSVVHFAHAMRQLAVEDDRRRKFGQRARQTYERRYRIDRTAARYLDFYYSLLRDDR